MLDCACSNTTALFTVNFQPPEESVYFILKMSAVTTAQGPD